MDGGGRALYACDIGKGRIGKGGWFEVHRDAAAAWTPCTTYPDRRSLCKRLPPLEFEMVLRRLIREVSGGFPLLSQVVR